MRWSARRGTSPATGGAGTGRRTVPASAPSALATAPIVPARLVPARFVPARRVALGMVVAMALALAACTSTATPPAGTPTRTSTTAPPGTTAATTTNVPSTSTLAVGTSEHALAFAGRFRIYRVYKPVGLPGPAPLVVMLHGGLGSAALAQQAYGWDALADQQKFIVAYPDGVAGSWNSGGGCCGVAADADVDDVGFLARVVAEIRDSGDVDPSHLYAAGMSNGAMMAYRMACDTDIFAAIGPVAGTQLGGCTNPAPLSVIHIHGTADRVVPYTGTLPTGVAVIDGPPIPDLVKRWSNVNRCGGTVQSTQGVVTRVVTPCPNGRAVELVTIEGGGHEWPGVVRSGPLDAAPGTPASASPGVAPTTGVASGVVATTELWAFFAAHPRASS